MGIDKALNQIKALKDVVATGGATPLHYLVMHSVSPRVEKSSRLFSISANFIVDKLLEKGVDVNAKNIIGFTPLHIAAKRGNFKIAKHLVDSGANIQEVDRLGFTPYHYALRSRQEDLINLLRSPLGEFAKGSEAEYFETSKWRDVEYDEKPSIYVFLGHGEETPCFFEREVLPEGYTFVTFSTCGTPAYGDDVEELMGMFRKLEEDPDAQERLAKGDIEMLKRLKGERTVRADFRVYRAGDKIPASIFLPISNQSIEDNLGQEYINPSGVHKITLGLFSHKNYLNPSGEERKFALNEDFEQAFENAFELSAYPSPSFIADVIKRPLSNTLLNEALSATPMEIMKRLGPGIYFFPSCRTSTCFVGRENFNTENFNNLVRNVSNKNALKVNNLHAENVRLTRRLSNAQQKKYFTNNYNTDNNILEIVGSSAKAPRRRRTRKMRK